MAQHHLHGELFRSPFDFEMPVEMQRWLEIDSQESMDWTSTMDSSPSLDDNPVIDVLNQRAPVAWNKWRRASVCIRACQKFAEALKQRQQKLETRQEELANEILRDFFSSPESLTEDAPSVEELSSMLKAPLVQGNSKNGKSESCQRQMPRTAEARPIKPPLPTAVPPPAFDWDVVLKLLDREEKRPAWSAMAADLSKNIDRKISELGEPITSNPEKIQAIIETAEEISKTLHASIGSVNTGLTTALEKLKVIASNCVTELLTKSPSPSTIAAKKKLSHHFEDSYAHLRNLVREKDKIAEGMNNLVKDLSCPELSMSSRVQNCSRSISSLVSSTLEKQSSEYISVVHLVDVYFGEENDPPPGVQLSDVSRHCDMPNIQSSSSSCGGGGMERE